MGTNEWVSTQIWQLCIHRLQDLELRNSIKGCCSSENLENTYSDIFDCVVIQPHGRKSKSLLNLLKLAITSFVF